MIETQHLVKVEAAGRNGGEPVVRLWTLPQLLEAAYNWGRLDGHRDAAGRALSFADEEGFSIGGTPLTELRSRWTGRSPDCGVDQR